MKKILSIILLASIVGALSTGCGSLPKRGAPPKPPGAPAPPGR